MFVQRLSIGDFVWVCRETSTANSGGNRNRLTLSNTTELILPYVVERKRTDDLAHSIRDGRYREQKYRLVETKLRVVYLIEAYGKGDWGLAEGALSQAMCNTQVQSGFHVQETHSIKDTCAYLTFMTRHLKSLYEVNEIGIWLCLFYVFAKKGYIVCMHDDSYLLFLEQSIDRTSEK